VWAQEAAHVDQRQDVEALQTAVLGLVYRAQEDLA
jgi:hypothetical protein